ncbi:HBL084Wp [Eremothecium sinecaudum]|uniref:HBL084Wp n=1 Tax=Eremothecium sinecaudum TaxID=45286 RepID=A0A109UWK5_9SACH|nr:HBL084Wp [Eremothecium sinecaudum]AMD18818.1 HBL084Wp [Eremothecium sinecaudum]
MFDSLTLIQIINAIRVNMSRILEWMDALDETEENYRKHINDTIITEVESMQSSTPHPLIEQLFPTIKHKWEDEYRRYLSNSSRNAPKRPADSFKLAADVKRTCIERALQPTAGNGNSINGLGTMISYLLHQELTLSCLLPKTAGNQWIINREYIERAKQVIQQQDNEQEENMRHLDRYRQDLQERESVTFHALEKQWQDKLNSNIAKCL